MFQNFGFDFMIGSALFGALNIIYMLVFLVLAIALWIIILFLLKDENLTFSDYKPIIIFGILGLVVIGLMIPSHIIKPKISIEIPKSQTLIEYQTNQEELQIITPQPRIEILEGFRPLKQN